MDVDELTRVQIDACCTQLNIITAEEPDRIPPNLYEMYTSIAALSAPIDISIVQRVWKCRRDEWRL